MIRLRFIQIGLCALLLASGCGPLKVRSAVPKDQVETVSLVGFDEARFWGDERSETMYRTFRESWQQERVALGMQPQDKVFPDSNYLAISGGGQNGAFGAGVMCGWSLTGKRPVFKVVTGISTGAITAPFAFLGSEYDAELKKIYTSVDQKDIAVFHGILSLLRADAAYDTAPLTKLAEKYFTQELLDRIAVEHRQGRRLFVGTTNLDAGRPVVWDIGKIACSDRPDRLSLFRKVLLASAAIPAAFPPVYLKVQGTDGKTYDEMHVDGGVTREMFLLPSELRLFELRGEESVERASHLYIIRNARYESQYVRVQPRVANIASRAIDTLITSQAGGDLMTLYYEAKENGMSYAVTSIPVDFEDDSKSLFDKRYMTRLFETGFEMGRDGKSWRDKPALQKEPTTKESK